VIIDLTDTTAAKINTALVETRRRSGSPAMGMVLTLVVVTDEASQYDALRAATDAAREHPSRILAVVGRPGGDGPRLDAEVRVGGESGPGELVLLRLHGALSDHAASVVLPLLLPDAPVVTWWPAQAPARPCDDPLGALAQRRVTDSAGAPDPVAELAQRARGYAPGDTDLAWTRLTTWRTLLAATLDDPYDEITAASVTGVRHSPSAELLSLWLGSRLGVPVGREDSDGPGITDVRLTTTSGDIAIMRADGRLAMLTRPGWPDQPVALKRRETSELLAEELRRLDPDEVYHDTLRLVLGDGQAGPARKAPAVRTSEDIPDVAAEAEAAEVSSTSTPNRRRAGEGTERPRSAKKKAGGSP
jgi:glucose-6-phosphate dehydrogenase assembly protein OpcA